MLAITVAAKGRMADSVLDAGADDYLHRPFTRAELIARTRAGPARAPGARQRPAAAHADGERPRRDLPLRLARGLHRWR
jgi:DNA-binding response OmpR family regulator